jgi:hypothetical protein
MHVTVRFKSRNMRATYKKYGFSGSFWCEHVFLIKPKSSPFKF